MSAPFQVGYCPIRQVMVSLCLSAAGIRFLDSPTPTVEFGGPHEALTKPILTTGIDHIGVITFCTFDIHPGRMPPVLREQGAGRICLPNTNIPVGSGLLT